MGQHHIIGKIIFELHTSSVHEVSDHEEELRALVADVIKQKLEEYCNEIDEQESVLLIDRLELDFGKINIASLEESVNSRITNCFAKQDRIRRSAIVKVKEEQSDLEKITYFLKTGLLPWRSTYTKNTLLPSLWIQNLLQKDTRYIIDIIKGLLQHRHHLQRFILNTPDEVLMLLFKSAMVPGHLWDFFQSMKEVWDANASFGSSKTNRLNFWAIVIHIFFSTDLKSKESIFYTFIVQWASRQGISISLLMDSLGQGIKNNSVKLTDRAVFVDILSKLSDSETNVRLHQAAHRYDLSQLATEIISSRDEVFNHRTLARVRVKLLNSIVNQARLFTDEQRKSLIGILRNFLKTLPGTILSKGMIEYLRFAEYNAPADVSFAKDLKQLQDLLQKIEPGVKDDTPGSNSVIRTIHELLNKPGYVDSIDQFILFLEKLQPVIQALPVSIAAGELVSYVVQLKVKLSGLKNTSGDAGFLKMFYQWQKSFMSFVGKMKGDEVRSMNQQLNSVLKAIPLSVFHAEKQEQYRKVILMLTQGETEMTGDQYRSELYKEIGVLADHDAMDNMPGRTSEAGEEEQAENDIYIHNAGLVLIAPFIKSLFERMGYVESNAFVDKHAIVQAIMLLQYIVVPEPECSEYDLPLNKLLCGQSVTASVDLAPSLSEEARIEAGNMLSAILQQTNVFSNISPEGFSNAFLNREGILRPEGNHWLLKVSKETFDIVLEKLPWQYHVVRLPWMTSPIVIEW